jgi:hypothetical protein
MSPEAKLEICRYCEDVLHPRAKELERAQYDAIPFRYLRWRRAYREHKQINATWRALNEIVRTA